jgi:hypothetical protein
VQLCRSYVVSGFLNSPYGFWSAGREVRNKTLAVRIHALAVAANGFTNKDRPGANVVSGLPDGSGPRHTRQALISGRA